MKILKLLFQYGQLNTSHIARRIGVNYETALTSLRLLEKEDLIKHRLSGKTRFFRLTNSSKAKAIIKLLQTWENKQSNSETNNSKTKSRTKSKK
jgi:Mn-dependent DtxR family transcriptional regulator